MLDDSQSNAVKAQGRPKLGIHGGEVLNFARTLRQSQVRDGQMLNTRLIHPKRSAALNS